MSGIASPLRRWWPEALWLAFAAANVIAVVLVPNGQTIPFHFVWISLTILYGFRQWSLRATALLLAGVCVVTGVTLTIAVLREGDTLHEVTEVPLMAAVFLAMVWHARRRQVALEELRRSTERQQEFVRDASHQLRTPITVARGHAELLRSATSHPQSVRDVDVILGELHRLVRISDRLLVLATADQVDFIVRTPVDLTRVVEEAAERWEAAAVRDWQLRVQASGTLLGDEERIESALDALIENAVKATDSGDRISVVLEASGDVAVIEVSDSGIGIRPEDLDRVFDRFWRARGPGARVNAGAGLGLAMVKAIAEAHDGSAKAILRSSGGTTLRMRLGGFTPAPGRRLGAPPGGAPSSPVVPERARATGG